MNPVSGKVKKPKVFVTEGKDVALTGVCVFFIRSDPSKAITAENIHRVRGQPFTCLNPPVLVEITTGLLECLKHMQGYQFNTRACK